MNAHASGMAIVAMTLVVGGCRMTKVCDSTGGMEVAQTEGGKAEVSVDDPCFREWLSVDSAVVTRAANGFLTAQVVLRNIHKDLDDNWREDDFDAQSQVWWFDANGVVVQPDRASWHRLTWHGGEALPIKAVAPVPEASRYVLRLRHVQ